MTLDRVDCSTKVQGPRRRNSYSRRCIRGETWLSSCGCRRADQDGREEAMAHRDRSGARRTADVEDMLLLLTASLELKGACAGACVCAWSRADTKISTPSVDNRCLPTSACKLQPPTASKPQFPKMCCRGLEETRRQRPISPKRPIHDSLHLCSRDHGSRRAPMMPTARCVDKRKWAALQHHEAHSRGICDVRARGRSNSGREPAAVKRTQAHLGLRRKGSSNRPATRAATAHVRRTSPLPPMLSQELGSQKSPVTQNPQRQWPR